MVANSKDFESRVNELQHLLGKDERLPNFKEPTLLRDVPSFSSHETLNDPIGGNNAKLEGRT